MRLLWATRAFASSCNPGRDAELTCGTDERLRAVFSLTKETAALRGDATCLRLKTRGRESDGTWCHLEEGVGDVSKRTSIGLILASAEELKNSQGLRKCLLRIPRPLLSRCPSLSPAYCLTQRYSASLLLTYAWAPVPSCKLHERLFVMKHSMSRMWEWAHQRSSPRAWAGRVVCFGEVLISLLWSAETKGMLMTGRAVTSIPSTVTPRPQGGGLFHPVLHFSS